MEQRPIEIVLNDSSHIERVESKKLRDHALELVASTSNTATTADLPDTLLELLTHIIRPLFSKEQHSKLTSTGRKNLVDQALPAALERFSSDALFDPDKRPLWKNGWTAALLKYILSTYRRLDDANVLRKTLDVHFHLLVPPILHQIDDIDIIYKVSGCRCLQLLCEVLHDAKSEILRRSGLADVFIEAMRNNFSLLPTLTPEDESLMLYQALYPAFRSLIKARLPSYAARKPGNPEVVSSSSVSDTAKNTASDEELRESYLTLILRHQLLYSLSHLSTGTGGGGTTSVSLSTFLLSQMGWIFADIGIASVVHLQTVLPLLRNILSDPFGTASPEMLLESVKALATIIRMTWPRIREKWWSECLRGIVNCWLNVVDDEKDVKDARQRQMLVEVKHELKVTACLLEDVIGESSTAAIADLIGQESLLEDLFDGII